MTKLRFNQVNKGLRALLFDTIVKWQQTDMTASEASKPVVAQVELLLKLFDTHTFVMHPAKTNGQEQELTKALESEHEIDLKLAKELRQKLEVYQNAADRDRAGYEVYYALNDFVVFNLKHMNREEKELNHVLWQHYTATEVTGTETRLQQTLASKKIDMYLEWIIKEVSDSELPADPDFVKSEAPDLVLADLRNDYTQNVPVNRWANVQRQLGEGVENITNTHKEKTYTCLWCKSELRDRAHRGPLVKAFLFWLPIKRYWCYKCMRRKYVWAQAYDKASL